MENNKENKDNDDKIIFERDHFDKRYANDDYTEEQQRNSFEEEPKKEAPQIEEQENQPGMNNPNPEDSRIDKDDPGKKPKKKFTFYLKRFLLILLVLILLGITVGAAFVLSWVRNAPDLNMDNFKYMEPTSVVDKNGDFYQELQGKEKREIVDIEDVPEHVKNAFIDIEDERFYDHNGVDLKGLTRATMSVITTGSLDGPGGSTITQQLIKLTHLTPEKRVERKVVEMYLAIQLEREWTKDQILESYLNKVGFANAWGVQAASQTYFRKDVGEISVAQAAVLASIIKNPTYYKPYVIEEVDEGIYTIKKDENGKIAYNEKNQERALAVIDKMKELNHLTNDEYQKAKTQLLDNNFDLHEPQEREIYSYFTDELYVQVVNDLMASDQFNFESREQAENYLLNSGLTVYSTIDPSVQKVLDENFANDSLFPPQSGEARRASDAMSKTLGEEVNYTPEGAMTIIDNSNGSVAGMVGGRNKDKSRSLNRATQKFQVGSSTKPLTVYAPGLETGAFTLGTTYDDVPLNINGWKPGNSGASYQGMITVREGLRKSKNMVAIQAWYDLGLENSVKYGELLGLEFVKEGNYNDMGPASLALGGYTKGQTTLAMASAFSTFPSQGTRTEPVMYTKVVDGDGNVLLENKPEKIRVFSQETAYLITDVLKEAVHGGTANMSVPNMEIAGKTGTTNDQMHAYFAGYTPYYTAAVWYGYDENVIETGGHTYKLNIGKYGGEQSASPAAMWQSVMRELHAPLKSKSLPSRSEGIVLANIDSVSGKLPTELSAKDPRGSTVISEMFISGTVPTARDDFHITQTIDSSTGLLATDYCPDHVVKTVVRIVKPKSRFPNGVTPLQANYKVAREQSVLAIDSNSICNVHNATSAVGVQFVTDNTPIDTLNLGVGQGISVQVIGYTVNSDIVQGIENLSVTSDSENVSVTPKDGNTFILTGVNSGTAHVKATISYKGVDRNTTYTDTIVVTVSASDKPVDETPEPSVNDPQGNPQP